MQATTIIQHPETPILTVLTWDEKEVIAALVKSNVFGYFEFTLQHLVICPCGQVIPVLP